MWFFCIVRGKLVGFGVGMFVVLGSVVVCYVLKLLWSILILFFG